MTSPTAILSLALILGAAPLSDGASIFLTESFNFASPTRAIPDADPSGIVDTQIISESNISEITSVEIRLTISGGFNGDLYAHLSNSVGLTVLVNRIGTTDANIIGSSDNGIDALILDSALENVHSASSPNGSTLVGEYQPDNTKLNLLSPNGPIVADLSGSETHTLDGWSLTINGIPEPSTSALLLLGSLSFFQRRKRWNS